MGLLLGLCVSVCEMGSVLLVNLIRNIVFYFSFLVVCSEVSVMFCIIGGCCVFVCWCSLVSRFGSCSVGCCVSLLLISLVSVVSVF